MSTNERVSLFCLCGRSLQGQELYRGLQVHSRNFTDAAVASGKRVLVVGGGKTAADVVTELTATTSAEEVTLLYRRVSSVRVRDVELRVLHGLMCGRLMTRAGKNVGASLTGDA